MSFFQFRVPTKIIHAEGIAQDFAHEVGLIGITKLFLVTDKFLYESGLCAPIVDHLRDNGIDVIGTFTDVPPDSSVKTVETCAGFARAAGADGILAIGGGSVLDTAKGANILFTLGGDLKNDYSGAQTITSDLAPLIAIPTTAGTGSEVTEAIVIYDEDTHTKLSFVDYHLLPTLAVLDPLLTLKLPPKLTAATGLDALTHAVEAVMSVQNNPVSDAFALEAISYVFSYLLRAVKNGEDIEARSKMLVASNLAGMAFNHAMVGVVHSVAHSIGAVARVHHGTANGIFLPFGLEYNLPVVADRIAKMGSGLDKGQNNIAMAAQGIIIAVRGLLAELSKVCGFPKNLSEAGVRETDLEKIAALAVEDGSSFYNPREVTAGDLLPFIQRAFVGVA